jgi:SAM-dependent methyltransferase
MDMKKEKIKEVVREGYSKIAKQGGSCPNPSTSCCETSQLIENISTQIGYTKEEMEIVPEDANLGLGCGNPLAHASLQTGDTVLDLGSGAGFDCFLAARKVGENGRVIGVDMTEEMVKKAAANALKGGYKNVEFRQGELEDLPVADHCVDLVISNCVINLVPDKKRVFTEVMRVLKPGGRFVVSDIVLCRELPQVIRRSVDAYIGCLAGALLKEDYLNAIRTSGFEEVRILSETSLPVESMANDPSARTFAAHAKLSPAKLREVIQSITSIKIQGVKTALDREG